MNDSFTSNATSGDGDLEPTKKEVRQPAIRSFKNILIERWREYILEIIVVIIGITISFTIANYQTNASNRSLEQTHLIGLLADIESDIDALSAVTEKTRMVVDAAQKIIDQSRRTNPTINKKEFISQILSTAERPNYVSKNTTFASLKSSGNFNLITDNELKLLLFAYDAQYQTLKTLETAELQVVVAITGPYILKYVPIDDLENAKKERINNVDVSAIMNDIEFTNNIILRRNNRTELLSVYIETLSIARQIKQALERNIE